MLPDKFPRQLSLPWLPGPLEAVTHNLSVWQGDAGLCLQSPPAACPPAAAGVACDYNQTRESVSEEEQESQLPAPAVAPAAPFPSRLPEILTKVTLHVGSTRQGYKSCQFAKPSPKFRQNMEFSSRFTHSNCHIYHRDIEIAVGRDSSDSA